MCGADNLEPPIRCYANQVSLKDASPVARSLADSASANAILSLTLTSTGLALPSLPLYDMTIPLPDSIVKR